MKQKKEGCHHYQRVSLIASQVPRLGPFLLGTENVWVQGETAGERAHDFISSNLTQLLQRVWEVICAYHCCQLEEGSLLMACDKRNIFPAVSILVYHQKCSPSLQRTRYFNCSYERSIFSSNVIPDFKHFSLPRWCETQTSWRFSQRESMLSLALPDQVQHVVQSGLNKGCKAKPFSNISWAPGCLGVDFILYHWSCYIYICYL